MTQTGGTASTALGVASPRSSLGQFLRAVLVRRGVCAAVLLYTSHAAAEEPTDTQGPTAEVGARGTVWGAEVFQRPAAYAIVGLPYVDVGAAIPCTDRFELQPHLRFRYMLSVFPLYVLDWTLGLGLRGVAVRRERTALALLADVEAGIVVSGPAVLDGAVGLVGTFGPDRARLVGHLGVWAGMRQVVVAGDDDLRIVYAPVFFGLEARQGKHVRLGVRAQLGPMFAHLDENQDGLWTLPEFGLAFTVGGSPARRVAASPR